MVNPLAAAPERPFYDVFISYRHRDAARIGDLERRIRAAGFEPFRDLNFVSLDDPADVTRAKIETIRRHLSLATCLILAYSASGSSGGRGDAVGAWMPWEVGFFDGALSSRIGVYLLDGPRGAVEPKDYFEGSEYLQLYAELTDANLESFLRRNAVRERRIDNVASGFVWLQNLYWECFANPANVALGAAEWFSDHVSRSLRQQGQVGLADAWLQWKNQLDDWRVTAAPDWRWRPADALQSGAAPMAPRPDAPGATYAPAVLAAGDVAAQLEAPAWDAIIEQVRKAKEALDLMIPAAPAAGSPPVDEAGAKP